MSYGDACPQHIAWPTPEARTFAIFKSLAEADGPSLPGSEDCLVLNIWTPGTDTTAKRPIMVWLHGGAFTHGSGSSAAFDGAALAASGDVVVVTLNHRLGPFGFLHLEDLGGSAYAGSGNVGMLDIVAALRWVHVNIERFGGDPGNVTVFGESGGGGKVCTLLAMPSAQGLFHRAIVQSGPFLRGNPRALAQETAETFLGILGVAPADLDALHAIEASRLVEAALATNARVKRGRLIDSMGCWAPVTDGALLPFDPVDPRAIHMSRDVPLIIGTTKDELTFPLFSAVPHFASISEEEEVGLCQLMTGSTLDEVRAVYRQISPDEPPSYRLAAMLTDLGARHPSTLLADARAAHGRAPVYVYLLGWETPVLDGVLRSPHMLDIPLVFGTFDAMHALVGDGTDMRAVARQMSAAWLAFARHGAPNDPAIPDWPAYDANTRPTLVFDSASAVAFDRDGAKRACWAQFA